MARKSLAVLYRPNTFEDVCHQEAVTTILKEQIRTKTFQHSYLFCGPAGTGKTTSARIFANEINKGLGSPIEIDAASNNGVDDVRNIIEGAKKKSLSSDYKVYILDECHALTSSAWAALLKLLEEPPKHAILIMCTTDPQKIPATIISRVQRYNLTKIPTEVIISRLESILKEEGINTYKSDAIAYIAKLASGGMRDAITSLDKCLSLSKDVTVENVLTALGGIDYEVQFKLTNAFLAKGSSTVIRLIQEVHQDGKDLKNFMKNYQNFILDICKADMFGSFEYTQFPTTDDITSRIKEYEASDLLDLLDFLLELNKTIKWDSNPLYAIQAMCMSYTKEVE